MMSSMAALKYAKEYAALRLRDRELVSWVGGSLMFLITAYATSTGRKLVKASPPPRLRMIRNSIASQFDLDEMSRSNASQSGARPQSTWMPDILRNFFRVLGLAMPSSCSKEARSIYISLLLMTARCYFSVRMVRISGLIGRYAVEGNIRKVLQSLGFFLLSCAPSALINVTLDYYNEMLQLHFRENLTRHFNDRYLQSRIFFRLAGLHEVDQIDHRVTEDIRNWARASASLFMNLTRPFMEALVFTVVLYRQTGWGGPALSWGYYMGYLIWVVGFAPNLDWLVQQRMMKEGTFRHAQQYILSHAEEIAATRGFAFQEHHLSNLFLEVTNQSRYAAYVRARYNLWEILYTKYGSVLLGYVVCAVAAVKQGDTAITPGLINGVLAETSYTFATLAKNIGKFLWSTKAVLVVSGYTNRLITLSEALERAKCLVDRQTDMTAHSPTVKRGIETFEEPFGSPIFIEESYGRVVRGEHIEFIDVPLTIPTGECLCPSLSFYVKPGMNVLVVGPNGCGKSSTFRLLGELWPLRNGRIIKPAQDQLYYVPQRPYMFDGTLLEQVIYPLKRKELTVGESVLYEHMEMAGLTYLFSKPNISWDSKLAWGDGALSLGEQQRLAMARLFFHRPRFAILDECSSLIDLEVEKEFYQHCSDLGITVMTIAHRRSVWQYHNWILYFDGQGGYLFSPLEYQCGSGELVLVSVISASDASTIGTEVRIGVHDTLYSDDAEGQEAGMPAAEATQKMVFSA